MSGRGEIRRIAQGLTGMSYTALHQQWDINRWQSALCLWTTPGAWPLAVAETRKELCINESASFTDPQLLEQAKSVLKSFHGLNLGEEEDRPAKRRKTLPDSGNDVNVSTYEHCKSILVGSDGQSSVSNLSDLHNMIQ
jgi:serine/threonine-protein kinase ATR